MAPEAEAAEEAGARPGGRQTPGKDESRPLHSHMLPQSMKIWVTRPSGNRIDGMRIAEIAPAEVGPWLPRAIEHMARVRAASGALREGHLAE